MAEWKTRPLASVCTVFADGDWIESKDQSAEGVRLVQTGNVGEGEFKDRVEKARFISQDTFARLRCTEIFAGDCLISRLPDPVGRACLIPETGERMITAVDCTIVRFDQSKLLPEFFAYYSQADDYLAAVEREATGTTRKRISRARLGQIQVPLAPLPEQRRIVAILDEAFEGIATAKANAEKNLQNARELFDNALQSLLRVGDGDRVLRNMVDVCDIPSKLVDPREEGYQDLPHVGAGNIEAKTGVLVDVLTARQEQLISGKFLFDDSMVLYSKIRPYLMKVVRPDFGGLCSADIYPLAPKPGVITRDYLFYLLLSPEFTEYAIKGSARAGMPKVNREHLFAYELSLPSVREQEQIAARLDAVAEQTQRLIDVNERKLNAFDGLKKSLLHQAFVGKLTGASTEFSEAAIDGRINS